MKHRLIDPEDLYEEVVNVLKHGSRTSTYKLATLSALIDYSVAHLPKDQSSSLDVPLAELSRRVMTIYWDQLGTFKGAQLRQSTQPQSRIFDAIQTLRKAADCPEDDQKIETAAGLAPGAFRRAVDEVGLCLAQQPLPRLQRIIGSVRSEPFLYDDSFLHDNVTRSELARNRNCIRLNPGVAYGLAFNAKRLHGILKTIWVEDVLRINRISADQQAQVEEHLFGGRPTPTQDPAQSTGHQPDVSADATTSRAGVSAAAFATRLNRLIAKSRNYSSGEVAADIRRSGVPMTVGVLTNLQAGVGSAPSMKTIRALARHFGVDPSYFLDGSDQTETVTSPSPQSTTPPVKSHEPAVPHDLLPSPSRADPEPAPQIDSRTSDDDEDLWGHVFSDDLDDIKAECTIAANGCWMRPSNTPVRCRHRGDVRKSIDLPKMGLHRWAWMSSNGYSHLAIPTSLIHIRRTCKSWTCCNPQHLFATSRSGSPLSQTAIANLVQRLPGAKKEPVKQLGRLVLQDNVIAIRNHCTIDKSGCWLAPVPGPVACRASDDARPDSELRMMSPHRWMWMVANGRSSNPLPAQFHVRRRCGNDRCCRPEHLYLTTSSGEEISLRQAESELREKESGGGVAPSTASYRKPSLFAERLNHLFTTHLNSDGRPYTSSDVADALQEDGLPISESLIERLRAGTGASPNDRTIDALAYFFDVEADYFSTDPQSTEIPTAIDSVSEQANDESDFSADANASQTNRITISQADLGLAIAGLSETIHACLSKDPIRIQAANRLLPLLAQLGRILAAYQSHPTIERSHLHRIVAEWHSASREEKHHQVIARLSHLLDRE